MLYSHNVPVNLGGQQYRNELRCQALEQLNPKWKVYTMDNKYTSDNEYVVTGRHCYGSFTNFHQSAEGLR
jgi:hypothetical protein